MISAVNIENRSCAEIVAGFSSILFKEGFSVKGTTEESFPLNVSVFPKAGYTRRFAAMISMLRGLSP